MWPLTKISQQLQDRKENIYSPKYFLLFYTNNEHPFFSFLSLYCILPSILHLYVSLFLSFLFICLLFFLFPIYVCLSLFPIYKHLSRFIYLLQVNMSLLFMYLTSSGSNIFASTSSSYFSKLLLLSIHMLIKSTLWL